MDIRILVVIYTWKCINLVFHNNNVPFLCLKFSSFQLHADSWSPKLLWFSPVLIRRIMKYRSCIFIYCFCLPAFQISVSLVRCSVSSALTIMPDCSLCTQRVNEGWVWDGIWCVKTVPGDRGPGNKSVEMTEAVLMTPFLAMILHLGIWPPHQITFGIVADICLVRTEGRSYTSM